MSRRRALLAALAVLAVAALSFQLLAGGESVAPRLLPSRAAAAIGRGSGAVGVSAEGAVLAWQPPPKEGSLPLLPLTRAPSSGSLVGTALQQARVLGAAPAALRPYLAGSRYGSSGVQVELKDGIELRFGADTELARKWDAAAAVLASPSVSSLDYVDLQAPGRPATGGSGHTLAPLP